MKSEHECPDCGTKSHYREKQVWGETAQEDGIVRECMICGITWWGPGVAFPMDANGRSLRD